LDPVWTLFSRHTLSRLAYWLSALGYDLRDRSITNRIYLIYFCVFWLAWFIAVLALLGGGIASEFVSIQNYTPPAHLVIVLAEYTLIIWVLVVFWQVSKRSPFAFSQEDAYLLCQTPVSRRKIGLAWFLQGIVGVFILFAAGSILLSFGLTEWRSQSEITITVIFEYLKAILRTVLVVMPIVVGWQAGLWGLGALRLHQRKQIIWLRLVLFGFVLFFLASFFFPVLQSLLVAPFSLPLEAAFMESISNSILLGGLGVSILYMVVGLAFLFLQTRNINLSRAAQETSYLTSTSQARRYGQFDLATSILHRRRLGMTHTPSRLLYRSGSNILFWKDLLQSIRTLGFSEAFNLILIFGLSLGMFSSSNQAIQILMVVLWTIYAGSITTRRLRNDLARWWLFRSLPLPTKDLFKDEIILSFVIYTLAGWLALLISRPTLIFGLLSALLLPILVINTALATAHDILRNSKARILMSPSLAEENVPRQGILGILQGLITILIPFGVLVLSSSLFGHPEWGAVAIPIAFIMMLLNRQTVLSAYHRIE
jgi:hypothetical protein